MAVVSDVFVDGQPAVSVAVEHRDGVHFTILQFYRRKRLGRGYRMTELSGQLSGPRVWA